MKKVESYLANLKGKDKAFNAVIDTKMRQLQHASSYPFILTKYTNGMEDILQSFPVEEHVYMKQASTLRQQSAAEQKNVCIMFNGQRVACEAHTEGVEIMGMEEGLRKYPFLVQEQVKKQRMYNPTQLDMLANAMLPGGVFIYVHEGVSHASSPVTIYLYETIAEDMAVSAGYSLYVIGKNSNVRIIREILPVPFHGEALGIASVDMFMHEGSKCQYITVNAATDNVLGYSTHNMYLDRDTVCTYNDLLFGGKVTNQKVHAFLEGENSSFALQGASFASGKQVFESYALINDIAQHTQGKVLYKNLLADEARLLFNGLIKVEKGADFTDSYLEDHTILLSDKAKSDSIPGLEIEADEVRASHGATVGAIEKEQLFYAMSRGLSEKEATRLIATGFVKPVIDTLPDDALQERILGYFSTKLDHAHSELG